ncbi:MAG: ferric reductase-like transmembrane domain-containing protein [Coriobacteriales bacterium]|nr:ferric reductase-like transmembrane domain-containing protein [Coriobacteriales bacterium]
MWADILSALLSIAIALIVAIPLGKQLKEKPWVFYIAAGVLVAAYLFYRFTSGAYIPWLQPFLDMMGKGYLACAFLAVVMFTGVFDEGTEIRRKLQPVRAELSIISFILILGHAIAYLPSYIPVLGRLFSLRATMAFSIILAVVLIVIFAVLTVTSFRELRAKIPYKTWKNIQRGSYVMVALLWLHIFLVLSRSAFGGHGSESAQFALIVYTVIVVAYAALRIWKAVRDHKKAQAAAEEK